MRLVYFSPIPASAYAQRPHFTVQAWLELGAESILWVDPYPCRLPRLHDFKRNPGISAQGTVLDARVKVLDVPALPIEPLPGGAWLNRRLLWRRVWKTIRDFAKDQRTTVLGIGRPSALALMALQELPHKGSFYDAMDDFPKFHIGISRKASQYYEQMIAAKVDAILVSSSHLASKFNNLGFEVQKVPNAYPMASLPPWQAAERQGIVLGYLGCFGSWFDWPLVVQLARRMPQAQIELVGPLHVPPPGDLPANIHLFQACKQSEAWIHLARFGAGLIPFRCNELTAGVDPIKYYEYRASGLPVLSTRFGEMNSRTAQDAVYFLDQNSDLSLIVKKALRHRDDMTTVARFRRDHDWRERFITKSPFGDVLDFNIHKKAA